jgi:hypothetical protein
MTLSITDTQQNNVLWTKQAHHTNTKLAQLIKAKNAILIENFSIFRNSLLQTTAKLCTG